jgi:hypothetical protein
MLNLVHRQLTEYLTLEYGYRWNTTPEEAPTVDPIDTSLHNFLLEI